MSEHRIVVEIYSLAHITHKFLKENKKPNPRQYNLITERYFKVLYDIYEVFPEYMKSVGIENMEKNCIEISQEKDFGCTNESIFGPIGKFPSNIKKNNDVFDWATHHNYQDLLKVEKLKKGDYLFRWWTENMDYETQYFSDSSFDIKKFTIFEDGIRSFYLYNIMHIN